MFVLTPTSAVTVRPYLPSDAEALFTAIDRNRLHLRQWLVWVDDTHTVRDTEDFIAVSMEQFARDDGYNAGIFFDDTLIGAIGLHYINRHNLSTEIGYWLSKGYNGQGIMTAAVRAVTSHAFTTWNLNRVEIRAAAGNARSRAIPERLGFTQEGILRQWQNIYGTLHDIVVYSLLRSEWQGDLRNEQDYPNNG